MTKCSLRHKLARKIIGEHFFDTMKNLREESEDNKRQIRETKHQLEETIKQLSAINHQVHYWPNSNLNNRISRLRTELRELANENNTLLLFWVQPDKNIINFGDEMSADIIRRIFHKKVINASADSAQMLGIGSIIEYYNIERDVLWDRENKIKVWGTGVRQAETAIEKPDDYEICALRGKLTSKKFELLGKVPLGDPGLLASLAYKKSPTTGKIGVVPHMTHMKLNVVKKLGADNRFLVIDPCRDPENVIKDITKCKLVLSSSLHGLVVADSFSIPNIHTEFGTLEEGSFKFDDYYSAFDGTNKKADIDQIFDDKYLANVMAEYKPIKNLESLQEDLIKAFPFR